MTESRPHKEWLSKRLGDVTSVGSGTGFPVKWQGAAEGRYPFYKVSDMNLPGNEVWMRVHNNAINESTRGKLKAKSHPEGTIIFPKIGAAIATNKKRILTKDSCFDNNVIGIHPSSEIDTAFLYHLLLCKDLSEFANTGNPPSIRKTTLEEWEIPLPPLTEQKRIARILDAADALRARRREALAQLDTLLQSTFLDMFGDPVTNPMGWEISTLDEVGEVQTGSTPPSKLEGMFDGEIPFVTPSDLRESWVEPSRTVTREGAKKSRTVGSGATLVCCIGATIGKMGKTAEFSAFNQQINAVSWGARIADNFGLEMMRFFKAKIAKAGASTTLPIIKKTRFQKISVPVPPRDLQAQFAVVVEAIEQQKAAQCAHLAELDTLFASLQSRAFRGDL